MTFKFHYRSGDLLEAEGKRRPSAPAPGTSRRSLSPKASTSSGRRTSSGGNDRKRTRDNGEDSVRVSMQITCPILNELFTQELERLREENKRLRAAASQSGRVKPETDDDDIIEIKPKLKKTAPGQRPVQRKVIVLD